jgi:hypothetical protein
LFVITLIFITLFKTYFLTLVHEFNCVNFFILGFIVHILSKLVGGLIETIIDECNIVNKIKSLIDSVQYNTHSSIQHSTKIKPLTDINNLTGTYLEKNGESSKSHSNMEEKGESSKTPNVKNSAGISYEDYSWSSDSESSKKDFDMHMDYTTPESKYSFSRIQKSELETFEKEVINKSSVEEIIEIMDKLEDEKEEYKISGSNVPASKNQIALLEDKIDLCAKKIEKEMSELENKELQGKGKEPEGKGKEPEGKR